MEHIAHGISADVYRAPLGKGYVCLKRVDLDDQRAPHDVAREARLLSRLHHPGVVQLLASFIEEPDDFTEVHWLVMPLFPLHLGDLVNSVDWGVDGRLLDSATGGAGFVPFVCRICSELANAVAYLHANGIAHRDIKPENVLVKEGHISLCDLGVSWASDIPERASYDEGPARLGARVHEVGSGAFRAPELLFAPLDGYDAYKIDIWALGTTIATMFTGLQREEKESETYDWEEELWSRAEEYVYRRKTLFDATYGDIGLAADIFSVLGLPSSESEWPEAAHFQPPLAQLPFARSEPSGSVCDRLELLPALSSHAQGAELAALVADLLPRMLVLSAAARPDAASIASAFGP